MNGPRDLYLQLSSLAIFRNLLDDPVIVKLRNFISAADNTTLTVKAYAEFVSELYQSHDNFSEYLYDFMLKDENFYIKAKATGGKIDGIIESALENELAILQNLSRLRPPELKGFIKYDGFLPDWNTGEYDFAYSYREHVKNISKRGFGMYSKYHMFAVSGENIVPVKRPDAQPLSALACYERERALVVNNTLTLLAGGEACNALLYGDAGTGKSSTVKAIVNEYAKEGLRLIEIKKHQLQALPGILGQLAENPLKFIVFIDDLSFTENDDDFTSLKAALEGSVSARSKNVVIYATSNRRHLVKETLSDREGDDIHLNDTLQEIMGLTARFGLTVIFERPDKETYLSIVSQIALEYGISPDERLLSGAEAFAVRKNGRSPRTAKQFLELQKSGSPLL